MMAAHNAWQPRTMVGSAAGKRGLDEVHDERSHVPVVRRAGRGSGCRALFDVYLGDDPIEPDGRRNAFAGFAGLLQPLVRR